ncbi:MAG: alginate export family protein [Nitrosospira sp.]|nr:alginate export family protein [Nitrosospira sp.]
MTDRNAGGAIQEKVVKYYWRIVLASAVSILPIGSIQANVGSGQSGKPQATRQGVQQLAQAGAAAANKKPAKSADENFKWAIKPLDVDKGLVKSVDDNFKWAIKLGDQPAAPPAPSPHPYADREYDWWEQSAAKGAAAKKPTSYHRRANSYATNPDSDPPRYVRQLSEIGVEAFKNVTWLDIGFEHRTRYEWRHNDIRHVEGGDDNPFFLRDRAYLGVKNILDPFRFAVEFQDSRVYNHKFASTDQENNPYDLIQGYGELYFKNALGGDDRGQNTPIRFRVGRMAYEATDRRFIARNEWRNTTNTFEGFRLNLGQQNNPWEVDLFGMQPVKRLQTEFDRRNDHLWFFGSIGTWRKWSDIITIQPYYMGQKQTADLYGRTNTNKLEREIHMPGFRAYGKVDDWFDFDASFNYQFGYQSDPLGTQSGANRFKHETVAAYGYTVEVGRNFNYDWKPRVSAFYGYASGDRDPNDNVNNRFDRFFGFARPWSADHYVIYENIKSPKIRFDLQPTQKFGIEAGYTWFWLASSTDRLFDTFDGNISVVRDPGFNRNRNGTWGDQVGGAFEGRLRYQPWPRVNTVLGYTHFTAGDFVKNAIAAQPTHIDQRSGNTDFLYFEVLISAF